jgi:hydroxymethylbilane synthase
VLAAIDDPASHQAVLAERALLSALGGNCHSPIAVLTQRCEGDIMMRAALFSPDGQNRVDGACLFAPTDAQGPAQLAADLLARASQSIRQHFAGPEGG